jgi:hypothetical protein
MTSTASVTKTRNLIAQKRESNLCFQQDDFGSASTWLPNFKIHYVITDRLSRAVDWARKLNGENGATGAIFSGLCYGQDSLIDPEDDDCGDVDC